MKISRSVLLYGQSYKPHPQVHGTYPQWYYIILAMMCLQYRLEASGEHKTYAHKNKSAALTYGIEDPEVKVLYVELVQRTVCVDERCSHDKEQGHVDPPIAWRDQEIHWTKRREVR